MSPRESRSFWGPTVTVLAGFLGAGKTTLLNHVLASNPSGRRLGVLVNDFGAINIDAELVVGVDEDTISLSNGCVCCTLRDDFVVSLQRLLTRAEPPDHIVIEASGVSDPGAIARGLCEPSLASQVKLDAVVVVADAEHFDKMGARERIVAGGQLRAADLVILNKLDLVDAQQRARVEQRIRKVVPKARIIPAVRGEVSPQLVLGELRSGQHNDVEPMHVHLGDVTGTVPGQRSHLDFETFSWRTIAPLSSRRLRTLVQRLDPRIYRAKGIVQLRGLPQRRAVLHVVGRRAELSRGEPWARDEQPRTELVFLGGAGAIVAESFGRELDACEYDSAAGSALDGPVEGVLRWVRSLWQPSRATV